MLLVSMFSGLATVILSCIMAGAVYTHMQLDEPVIISSQSYAANLHEGARVAGGL